MALPEGPTVLPFKSEKLSFSLAYKTESAPTAQVELACVCFDRDAQVLDFVQFNRRAALNSSLTHSACSYLPPKDAVPGADEAIHMYPFDLSPQCEVMLLLASAPRSPFLLNDLGSSGKLQFRAHARELGAQAVQLLDVDHAPLVHLPARQPHASTAGATAAGPLSNGHQTMVIAAVYTTPQGWSLSFDCSTFPEDHWGLLLPQLRKLLRRWPDLSAATAAAANPKLQQQVVVCSRKASDSTILQLAARTAAPAPPAASTGAAAASSEDGEASDDALDPGSAPRTPRDSGSAGAAADGDAAALRRSASADADAPAPAAAAAAAAAAADATAAAAPDRLTLELGWDTFRPRIMLDDEEGEEEEEEPVVEFALAIYNLQGDEIATISIDNPEFEGVTVEEEPVQEESEGEEEEQQQQEPAGMLEGAVETEASAPAVAEGDGEAAEAAEPAAEAAPGAEGSEGEGAAGEDAEDDGFVKEDTSASDEEKEETEEEKAARAAAAAEAAAAAAQRAAANQRPLTEKFPLKHRVHLTLPELPPDARALVLTMSSFGSSGFKNVKTLQARLLVAPPQQQQAEETGEAAEEGEEEEKPKKKKGPKQPERVLVHYRFDSVQGADAHLTQVLVLKLYKEYADSAFAVWAQHKVPDVASLFGGARAVEAAAAAAAGSSSSEVAPVGLGLGLSCEAAKTLLQEVLAARKQLEVDLAERRARAEEEGLDEEEDMEYDLRMDRAIWRVRVVGLSTGGESPDDLAPTISNLLAYDGDLDAAGDRTSPACKVAYPNRDTYFGPYAAGAKSGTGLYVAASGAAYAGQYAAGKRCGFGLMVLPDGGIYKGGFKDDKFDGQGSYLYPDMSLYTGGWRAGKKHGQGTYWDSAGGCLRGSWVSGNLKGQGQYDQPHYHFEGQFAKGLPAGPCSFSMSSDFRVAGLPQAAASYIIAPHGPTLTGQGKYALPPGAADEKGDGEAEEGAEEEGEGEEGSTLPAWPKYEGLAYQSELQLPCGAADIAFPPPSAVVATI